VKVPLSAWIGTGVWCHSENCSKFEGFHCVASLAQP
jgi:hypothetical protein